ncbi:class I SAM-dependent DNA methyltransferase [Vallitalea okinawensis]|uniref:class I SAM-dependent DNA methyltransferase n=1 Tax=Vallitalea okinawensis TaxID=2078660 RepID=UPI000CFC84C7|nr:class I SAM-dependent methyltransferase [Vallitalea okinawensis]
MYDSFAYVYDKFMENVPYDQWVEYIQALWSHYSLEPQLVLDLACGTGEVTYRLAEKNYDMIGIDISNEMLNVAREKTEKKDLSILFLEQDMREFELYGTVSSIVCICDGLNYLHDEEDLLQVFSLANNYLDPKGLFIFDMNTAYKYEMLGQETYTDVQDECAYIWDNYYDEVEHMNEYHLTIFDKERNGLYRKYEETHYQRAYTKERVCQLLKDAGLQLMAVYDAFTFDEPKENSERLYFIAREKDKEEN